MPSGAKGEIALGGYRDETLVFIEVRHANSVRRSV
jgi:hypothetical protein